MTGQTDIPTNLSPIDEARQAIDQAKTLGYSHALLCLTPFQKQDILDRDLLSELRDEGFKIFPGTTPDLPKLAAGIERHEIIMITWPRPALPEWAIPKTGTTKKSAKKPTKKTAKKKPAAKPKKKPTVKAKAKAKEPPIAA